MYTINVHFNCSKDDFHGWKNAFLLHRESFVPIGVRSAYKSLSAYVIRILDSSNLGSY